MGLNGAWGAVIAWGKLSGISFLFSPRGFPNLPAAKPGHDLPPEGRLLALFVNGSEHTPEPFNVIKFSHGFIDATVCHKVDTHWSVRKRTDNDSHFPLNSCQNRGFLWLSLTRILPMTLQPGSNSTSLQFWNPTLASWRSALPRHVGQFTTGPKKHGPTRYSPNIGPSAARSTFCGYWRKRLREKNPQLREVRSVVLKAHRPDVALCPVVDFVARAGLQVLGCFPVELAEHILPVCVRLSRDSRH
jgi:hypothetical protein